MEKFLQGISGSLHILAAVTWIGSMIYSEFAVAPALKHLGAPRSHAINMIATRRFSPLTWTSLVVLIVTGIYAIYSKIDKLTPLLQKPTGIVLFIKLLLVGALIVILLFQVYTLRPKMKKLISPATPKDQENTLEMAMASNKIKFWSRTYLVTGIVVIILSVILSGLLK